MALGAACGALLCLALAGAAPAPAAAAGSAPGGANPVRATVQPLAPSRATVLEAQRLFHVLGYPLGSEPAGAFGVRTRGALTYFQRKYGLPVSGYPDARTLARMRAVAASLRGTGSAGSADSSSTQHDLVERVLGEHLPIFGIAVALAALLCLLALGQRRSRQDSATAEDSIAAGSEER